MGDVGMEMGGLPVESGHRYRSWESSRESYHFLRSHSPTPWTRLTRLGMVGGCLGHTQLAAVCGRAVRWYGTVCTILCEASVSRRIIVEWCGQPGEVNIYWVTVSPDPACLPPLSLTPTHLAAG